MIDKPGARTLSEAVGIFTSAIRQIRARREARTALLVALPPEMLAVLTVPLSPPRKKS